MLWRCCSCGSEWSDYSTTCSSCLGEVLIQTPFSRDGARYGSPGARPHRRKYRATTGVAELLQTAFSPTLFTFGYEAIRQPRRSYTVISGPSGSGKSTLAMNMGLSLALQGGQGSKGGGLKVLLVSAEEGAGPSTVRRLKQCLGYLDNPTLSVGNPLVSDKRALRDVHDEVAAFEREGGDLVVVDSYTVLGCSSEWCASIATTMGIILVVHQNGRGGPMGGERIAYDCDTHVQVKEFQAELIKTRWSVAGAPAVWRVDDVAKITPPKVGAVVPFPRRKEGVS